MTESIMAMLTVLAVWVAGFTLIAGQGMLLRNALNLRVKSWEHIFECFWVGLALLTTTLMIWHFAFAITVKAWIVPLILGGGGALKNRREIYFLLKSIAKTKYWLLAGALFCVWYANRAIGPAINDDTGLYHLPAILTMKIYPLIVGWGNLYGRFAFNNSNFLYGALFDTGFLAGTALHTVGAMVILATLGRLSLAAFRLTCGDINIREAALGIIFFAFICELFSGHFNGLSADIVLAGLGIMVFDIILKILYDHKPAEISYDVIRGFILAALGVTIKLSFAVIGGLAMLLLLLLWLMRSDKATRGRIAPILAISCAAIIVGLWIARGIIISGYPAYPVTFAGVDVDWKIPKDELIYEQRLTMAWTRQPFPLRKTAVKFGGPVDESIPHDLSWVRPRVKMMFTEQWSVIRFIIPALLALVGFIMTKVMRPVVRIKTFFLLPWIAGTLFWFYFAPIPRFAGSAVWVIAAAFCAPFLMYFLLKHKRLRIAIPISAIALFLSLTVYHGRKHPTRALPIFHQKGFAKTPVIKIKKFVTDWGVELNTSAKGPFLWAMPFPATDRPRRKLRLRIHGELRSGFRIQEPDFE